MNPNDPSNSENIRKAYDETAEIYDNRYEKIQFTKYSLLLPKIWNVKKNNNIRAINFDVPILDFGGGGGLLLKFLRKFAAYIKLRNIMQKSNYSDSILQQFNPDVILLFEWMLGSFEQSPINIIEFTFPDIVVCDISPKMLIYGKQVIKNYETLDGTEIIQNYYGGIACTGEFLPIRDNIFPLITSFTVLQNIRDKKLTLKEIERISIKNSKITISVLKKAGEKMEFVSLLGEYLNNLKSILLNEDTLREFKVLKNKIESYFDVFIENHELDAIRDIEDYLFYSKLSKN